MIVERILTADGCALELQIVSRSRRAQIMELDVAFEALRTGVVLNWLDVEAKVYCLTHRAAAGDFHRSRHKLSQIAGAACVIAVTTVHRRNAMTACRQ